MKLKITYKNGLSKLVNINKYTVDELTYTYIVYEKAGYKVILIGD